MNQRLQQNWHRWEEFLDPEVLRPRLISAAVYIAAFESLKDAIVERIREFFWQGFDESGEKISPDYQSKVLARNRSRVYASLDWLKEMQAINTADMEAFERVKECRNVLAHQLFKVLGSDGLPPTFAERFGDMVALVHKIDHWWIVNVEIPTNPDLDDKEIEYDQISSGRVMMLQVLCDVALGEPEQSKVYYEGLREHVNKSTQHPE